MLGNFFFVSTCNYAAYKKTTGTNKTFNAIFIKGAVDGLPKQQSFCLVLQKKIRGKFGKNREKT